MPSRPTAKRSKPSAAPDARLLRLAATRPRVGIFELMELNDEIRKLIMANADAVAAHRSGRARNGMRNLREDGWMKVRHGRDHRR